MMTKRGKTKAQLQAELEYQQLLRKWESVPKFARTQPAKVKPIEAKGPIIRETPKPASFSTPGGSTALKPSVKYTGDAMRGIATMHKSNAVPVFDKQAAIEVAQMRRS